LILSFGFLQEFTVRYKLLVILTVNESALAAGCTIDCIDGATDVYDGCIIAVRAPDSLRMLGKEATFDETRILGAFQYVYRYFRLLYLNTLDFIPL